jgi:ribonucleoside-diphosphate reductase alpha chain
MSDSFQWRTPFAERIFKMKYAQGPDDTWPNLCRRLVDDVCGTRDGTLAPLMSQSDRDELTQMMIKMQFIPGGRYLYYAGRSLHFYNNCFCLKAEEDTREEWGRLVHRASDCLMSGGGIGIDYSILRENGRVLHRTGGISSGPIPLMRSINEVGRNVMQGGSRRSAIFASLNWQHGDIQDFLRAKDWTEQQRQLKEEDFNFPLPLDMTNISISWDTAFIEKATKLSGFDLPQLWYDSVKRMCKTGEPGHCYNFYENEKDTLRNACTEFTSEDDSDVCNLGSVNLGNIKSIEELTSVVSLASKFLVCGTIRGDVPYTKVKDVREKNRKLGLGLMGIHEWLLQRGYKYEVVPELHSWLEIYKNESERSAREHCDRFYLSHPKKFRAIAPAGTIGILASTTTGIEPLYAVAYKRRYLEGATQWKYEYVIEPTAERLVVDYGLDPDGIETALKLSETPEQRIKFQADIQDYVDMGISSTLNLPAWGTKFNNFDTVTGLAEIVARYCHRLRGITCYPDGGRGAGQPLTAVSYEDAKQKKGVVYYEDENRCVSGVCGI